MSSYVSPAVEAAILDACREAGAAIRAVADRRPDWKEDGSPVTEADKAAHVILMAALQTACPHIPILSEEGAEDPARRTWTHFFLVDPLDGTKEFLKGGSDYTVNVALIDNGQPVWGIVLVPETGVAYIGDVARKHARRITAESDEPIHVVDPPTAPRVVVSKSHRTPETDAYLALLGDHEAVSAGSSLKLCRIAEGTADLYPRVGPTMEWDTGAGHAVVLAAGGAVVDPDGAPLQYNKESLLNPWFVAAGRPDQYPTLKQVSS